MAARELGSVVLVSHLGSSHYCPEHPGEVTSKRILDLPWRVEVEELGVRSRLKTGQGMGEKTIPRCQRIPGWIRACHLCYWMT